MGMNRLILLCCFLATPAAADVYKWTDDEGRTHYGDRYRDGAERVTVRGAGGSAGAGGDADEEAVVYTRFGIATPKPNESLSDPEGKVPVSLFIEPSLAEGHSIAVIMNGKRLPQTLQTAHFQLRDVQVGTHSVKASVINARGEVLASAETVTFHVQPAAAPTSDE